LVTRTSTRALGALFTATTFAAALNAQALLDRVVARVNSEAITMSDARAAAGLGLVGTPPDDLVGATRALIQRRLMLNEVDRFSPPEPKPDDIDREVAVLETRPGPRPKLEALMAATGLNVARIRELARDSLRIQAYLTQRFGANPQQATIDQWTRDLRRRATVVCYLPDC
jgi:hypothetical protein